MAQPGWYPDPAGTRGHFRYWDGTTWSTETTTDPTRAAAPASAGSPAGVAGTTGTGSQAPRGRGRGPLLALLAALVVVALGVWWLTSRSGGGGAAAEDTNTAAPTVSAWNETSTPSASASSSSAQPSAAAMTDCPASSPQTLSHPSDGRLHGGHVSVESLGSPWATASGFGGPRWVVDDSLQEVQIVQNWVSSSMVGGLVKADGFTTPQQAAEAFMSCYASSSFYLGFTGRTDKVSQAVTIDGKSGWYLRSEVRVDFAADPNIAGDVVDIIVLDTGDSSMLSFWEGNATIGDTTVQAQIDQVRGTLKVDS